MSSRGCECAGIGSDLQSLFPWLGWTAWLWGNNDCKHPRRVKMRIPLVKWVAVEWELSALCLWETTVEGLCLVTQAGFATQW